MPKAKELRSEVVYLRLTPNVKTVAEKAAEDDRRSLSSLIERALIEHLQRTGYLKKS